MTESSALKHLSRLYGVQTAYYDVNDRLCTARPESLFRVLQLLGAPVERMADVPTAVRDCRRKPWQRPLEPVQVAWNGRATLRLRLPADRCAGRFECRVSLEQGSGDSHVGELRNLPVEHQRTVDGIRYAVLRLEFPTTLATGYHRLRLEWNSEAADCLVMSAPLHAFRRESAEDRRRWGVFVPLYALHRETSWGGGDFSDLEAMMHWVSTQGGSFVATLPLLSWLSEVSDDPSPYSPASRLFWNEFYLDVTRIPELPACDAARDLLHSDDTRTTLQRLRDDPLVDYPRQMQLKRDVLMRLSEFFFSRESPGREELDEFRRTHPELETYARFRAVGERQGTVWPAWPQSLRDGHIQPGDFDERIARYHLYTQWQVERQLQSLAERARDTDMLWYLDFPLGVAGAGYDVWRQPNIFGRGASGGAPPDAFFTKGQNWGFPPLHPLALREQGYDYLIQSLRRHLQYARLLRIDHVMGLHRLYWIPDGLEAGDGVYVRYRTEEMFALLSIESHRHQAEIVGENLGTVPAAVNDAMERHRIRDMFVVQYEAKPEREPTLPEVFDGSVASLNTHDMPPFASYWTALDVDDRVDLGLLTADEAAAERDRRAALRQLLSSFLRQRGLLPEEAVDPRDVLKAFLAWLAESEANVVLANLEDLWAETQPQNTPGTFRERCNWRKKLRYRFEEFRDLPEVVEPLALVNRLRSNSLS